MKARDDLKNRGLKFIGVVKTSTRDFCMEKLSEIDISQRGLWKGYFALDD